MTVEPARLARDADGQPYSALYGDVYASRDGALGQARHVFLGGTECVARWRGRRQFVVLELGFGLGVNFLATRAAWRDDPARCERLHYVAVERHPLPADELAAAAPGPLRPLADELARAWPLPLPGLHGVDFDAGAVRLTLAFGDVRSVLPQLVAGADAIYLDGFAPERNPAMWEPAVLKAVARCARPGAMLATYSTASAVRDALSAAGFEVTLRSGYGRKRRMLTATYAPRWRVRRHEPPAAHAGERRVAIVGAGLAGAACAQAFARRGWAVTVLAGEAPAASTLPWGLAHPQFARDDNVLARMTRAGAALMPRALAAVVADDTEPLAQPAGVFQQAADAAEAHAWREALAARGWPAEYVAMVSAQEAAVRLGVRPRNDGLWWPGGASVAAARLTRAQLTASGATILRATAAALTHAEQGWQVHGADGAVLAQAPQLVVACAHDAPRLLGARQLPVKAVPGQVSLIEAEALRGLRAGLGGDGTLLRAPDGTLLLGASYGESDVPAHEGNLARLGRLLAAPVPARVVGGWRGVRCVAHDRLPYCGPVADEVAARTQAAVQRGAHLADLPRRAGLLAAFAFGSRGLTLAALGAELIAAQIEGEPWPVERDLGAALDPARVLLQRLRRGG
jgi:tRNA 5-methylaminomethyl-2-thiouridine biosynthesis bifunctional protein